jgi:HAE1 family hydrophobic/amphiphilic exporter-1
MEHSTDSRYLDRLEFDPKLRRGWLNFFVSRTRVVLLLILILSGWGIYSYQQLPRESNPEVKIPVASITTSFPGASPADVEELVTKKIETSIAGLKDVKKVTSNSSNSFSSISVEFEATADLKESIRSVRDQVSTVTKDLPTDATEPSVNEVSFDDQPIITFALSGDYESLVLRDFADTVKDTLEKISDVREVRISGGDEREFSVAYDPAKLESLGLTPFAVNQTIAATNKAVPAGNFEGDTLSYPVRSDDKVFTAEALGAIPILHTASAGTVLLRDVARVQETAIKHTVLSRVSAHGSQPQNAVTLAIVKKTGGSVLNMTNQSRAAVTQAITSTPLKIQSVIVEDFSEQITHDFDQLSHDFLLTVALVMITLFLIVGLKEALIAGLAIPLVFFITFGVMQTTGTSLNFLSLFSLLLSLGLLVDDAIVVVSATKQYMKSGKFTPEEAILLVLRDFKIVLLTTTLATTWAFLPLLLSTGMIGQFIKSIPITVSVTLIASLFVALFINHPLAAVLERIRFVKSFFWMVWLGLFGIGLWLVSWHTLTGVLSADLIGGILFASVFWYRRRATQMLFARNRDLVNREWQDDALIKQKLREQGNAADGSVWQRLMHGIVQFDRLIPVYERYLRWILATKKREWLALGSTVVIFLIAVALPVIGVVKTEFFPPSDEKLLFLNITGPTGWNLTETDALTQHVERQLMTVPEIASFSTIVGRPGVSNNRAGSVSGGSTTHLSNILIKLSEPEARTTPSYTLATNIQSQLNRTFPGVKITVESEQGGPPAGAAFQAQISGDDLQQLDRIANDLKGTLADIPGVINPDISLKPAPAEYTFALDANRLAAAGLDAASVGSTLRLAISGIEVSTVLRENKEIKIVARFDAATIPTLEDIRNIPLINHAGESIALRQVATVRLDPSIDSITRIDQKRTVVLSSGVTSATTGGEVLKIFQSKIAQYQFPQNYTITYGGENEQNQESVASILRAMLIAAFLIVATMVLQFNSFRQAAIVLVTLPLALIGVFVGLALFQVPLSFPGLIGILALFGIVVKNAIILIDKINLNHKIGIDFDESIIDAGKSRIEAIFITSICTIFGILPITLSNALWQALGSAVIFGLMLSSFLTLFIVPVLFSLLLKPRKD